MRDDRFVSLRGLPPRSFFAVLLQHSIPITVRYCETDAMGFLHHSNYLNYFELGRTELFRAQGGSYRRMEEMEMFFVVVKFQLHYRRPARFDDQLTLVTSIVRSTPARVEHEYELRRGDEVLCTAGSTVACVGRNGQPRRIPDNLAELTGGGPLSSASSDEGDKHA